MNGKTYEMQYLTDEETAVINAMRLGAKVQVNFFNSTERAYAAHLAKISTETFPTGSVNNLGDGLKAYRIESGKVDIVHFIKK